MEILVILISFPAKALLQLFPLSDKSESTHPVNLFFAFHSLCPCLIKII